MYAGDARRKREKREIKNHHNHNANTPTNFIYNLRVLHVQPAPDTRGIGRWSIADGRCVRNTEKRGTNVSDRKRRSYTEDVGEGER
jgi:hypothetical protein